MREVLEWVNETRAEHNIGAALDALPRGWRSRSPECPIARALSAGPLYASSCRTYTALRDHAALSERIEHPPVVSAFIKAFDEGYYPDLIEAA